MHSRKEIWRIYGIKVEDSFPPLFVIEIEEKYMKSNWSVDFHPCLKLRYNECIRNQSTAFQPGL